MKIEVDNGTALDKLSILEIKYKKTGNEFVLKEKEYLSEKCADILSDNDIKELYNQLLGINTALWDLETDVRKGMTTLDNYMTITRFNDKRAFVKLSINKQTSSEFREIKSY